MHYRDNWNENLLAYVVPCMTLEIEQAERNSHEHQKHQAVPLCTSISTGPGPRYNWILLL